MTNHALQNFKTWLNEDENHKQNLPNWDAYLNILETKKADLNNLFIYADFNNTISSEEQAKYVEIIENWIEQDEDFFDSETTNQQEIDRLKTELQDEKDKIATLQAEYQELNKQLENIRSDLALTPSTPHPEKQPLKEKINYFNSWIKRNKQENTELLENIKKEQKTSQEIRSSLLDLEQQLKDKESQSAEVEKLTKANQELKKGLFDLNVSLANHKNKVSKLEQENKDLQAKLAASELSFSEEQQKNPTNPYIQYLFIVILVGGSWLAWRKMRN